MSSPLDVRTEAAQLLLASVDALATCEHPNVVAIAGSITNASWCAGCGALIHRDSAVRVMFVGDPVPLPDVLTADMLTVLPERVRGVRDASSVLNRGKVK